MKTEKHILNLSLYEFCGSIRLYANTYNQVPNGAKCVGHKQIDITNWVKTSEREYEKKKKQSNSR